MSERERFGGNSCAPGVLSPEARELYLSAVRDGGRLDVTVLTDNVIGTCEELKAIGLLVQDTDEPRILIAVDPTQLSARLSSTWQRQALDLLGRAVSLPAEFQDLAKEFDAPEPTGGPVEYVRGKVLINQRIAQYLEAMEEALALQPGGPRPPEVLTSLVERDLETLRRGKRMRTVYHASTRYHQPTREYVATLARAGGQYRTLDEPYTRLIIMDRRVAVIPVADDMSLAAFIHDPGVVNYLAEEVFERMWSRALDFEGDRAIPQQVVSRLRQTIIDLLLDGTNHRVIARRLGISERTLARHIAEMREEHQVESLFQLGYVLARTSQGGGGDGKPTGPPARPDD